MSHLTKPGYESHGMRICETCYYKHPVESKAFQAYWGEKEQATT
jgi:hypothetical protein